MKCNPQKSKIQIVLFNPMNFDHDIVSVEKYFTEVCTWLKYNKLEYTITQSNDPDNCNSPILLDLNAEDATLFKLRFEECYK